LCACAGTKWSHQIVFAGLRTSPYPRKHNLTWCTWFDMQGAEGMCKTDLLPGPVRRGVDAEIRRGWMFLHSRNTACHSLQVIRSQWTRIMFLDARTKKIPHT
jgi:hypothetical protein